MVSGATTATPKLSLKVNSADRYNTAEKTSPAGTAAKDQSGQQGNRHDHARPGHRGRGAPLQRLTASVLE